MGLLDQEDGRQLIRMRMAPAEDEAEPWRRPLMILTAVRWDPVRASTMRDNELVAEMMRAFRRAIDVAGAPGRPASASPPARSDPSSGIHADRCYTRRAVGGEGSRHIPAEVETSRSCSKTYSES